MGIDRVAVIFDDRPRPETTGVYCLSALQKLVEVQHVLPNQLHQIRPNEFDLFLRIDDGLEYSWPDKLRPAAWWAIDTHMDLKRCIRTGREFDRVFAAQKNGAASLREAGLDATWLPLACDEVRHGTQSASKTRDVAFVGTAIPGERSRLLGLLKSKYPNCFVGQCYFEEMAQRFAESRIVFNRSIRDDINMRVFEGLCSGSLLVTNDLSQNGLAELFQDGMHLATYDSDEELLDKINFYLEHSDARERIAAAFSAEVKAKHTYAVRMRHILEEMDRDSPVRQERNSKAEPVKQARLPVKHFTDRWYYQFDRPEVVEVVPPSAKRVLDVGCGAGRLGAGIKARQQAEVTGLEQDRSAAVLAEGAIDHVFLDDIENTELDFENAPFDAIVCADVLEHLEDTAATLGRLRRWLQPNGQLVVSIPNARHHSVVRGLLDGNWTYEAAGLLDKTHRQFFTRRDFEALLKRTGFSVLRTSAVPGPGFAEWQQQGRPNAVRIGSLNLEGIPQAEAEEFFVYQYLFVASPQTIATETTDKTDSAPIRQPDERVEPRVVTSTNTLSILYVADFESPGKAEQYAASAIEWLGHRVERWHDQSVQSPDDVVRRLASNEFDCLLFYKGCLGARTMEERLQPSGDAIAQVLKRTSVPGYTWYFDRVFEYAVDRSREAWMRKVAPLCRKVFLTDGALAQTDWGPWHLLRQGVHAPNVEKVFFPEDERQDVAFIGQVYGDRGRELGAVSQRFEVDVIEDTFGTDLNEKLRSYRVILGPSFPSVPHYWSNRLYVVLGHGGFFLAPEVEGMAQDGFVPGLHYARLGADPVTDIEYWLGRSAERERIGRAGQQFVLGHHTYEHRVCELIEVIQDTL